METFYNIYRENRGFLVTYGTVEGTISTFGPFDSMKDALKFTDIHRLLQPSDTKRIFNEIIEEVYSDRERFDERPTKHDQRINWNIPQHRPCRKEIRRYMFEIQGRPFGSGASAV